jgi:transposase
VRYKERNEEYRDVFRVVIETTEKIQKIVGVGNIVYIDESWIDHNEIKSRSWSPIGAPILSDQYGYKYKRTTLLAWVRWDTVLAPLRFEGSTNADIFNMWIEECLCPELKEWDIVVMDNASFHKSQKTRELIERRGARLLYLPPYSPDLNPIENYWALLKLYVRKYNTSFDIFYQILDEFMSREKWLYAS